MTDKYASLRATLRALKAETEGRNGIPWFDPRQVLYEEVTGEFDRELPPIPETDMAYIAAANPATIQTLLAERDAMHLALNVIRDWQPPHVLSRGELVPMATALGSNGERDYFRGIASATLTTTE